MNIEDWFNFLSLFNFNTVFVITCIIIIHSSIIINYDVSTFRYFDKESSLPGRLNKNSIEMICFIENKFKRNQSTATQIESAITKIVKCCFVNVFFFSLRNINLYSFNNLYSNIIIRGGSRMNLVF